jgi:outer membrane protein TolC
MKLNPIFFTIFIILICKNSWAFSVENAIDFAIKNNHEIKLYEDKLKNSKNFNYRAIAEFLPKISVNIQSGERVNNNSLDDNRNDQKKTKFHSREISVEQNIFNGFSSIINFKKSDKQYLIELLNLKDKKQNLAVEVVKFYANIFWQKKNLESYKKILKITQQVLDIKSRKFASKLIDKEELIQEQIVLSNLNQKILSEELELVKNHQDFFALVGAEFEGDKKIDITKNNFKKSEVLQKIEQNFLLQSKYLKYQLSLDDQSSRTSEFLPKISIISNISKQKNNLYYADKEINNRSIILNFSIPIFQQGLEFIDYKSSKNQSEIVLDEYQIYKNNLIADISKVSDEIDATSKNLIICYEILNFLEEKKRILQSKHNAKIIDLIEFYNAEIALEEQKITHNKLENLLTISCYKVLGLIGEVDV